MKVRARFLLDENIHLEVAAGLRREGIDAVHVRDLDLLGRADEQVMNAAIAEQRIVVTGDSGDFTLLAGYLIDHGIRFPGVLLVPSTMPSRDPGGLIRAISRWTEQRDRIDGIPGGVAWLSRGTAGLDGDRLVRERQAGYRRALRRLETMA